MDAIPGSAYIWLKALHVAFMVTWFAGLFYLPRLFVYHSMLDTDDRRGHERFLVMERKLFAIMTLGAVLTTILGLALLWDFAWLAYRESGWLHAKLAGVVLLFVYHGWCYRLMQAFRAERNRHSHRWFRWFNEVPAVLLLAIVVLAVVKPF